MGILGKVRPPRWARKKPISGGIVATLDGPGDAALGGDAVANPRYIRPDLGFDRERAAYAKARPGLLRSMPGRFVVFVGDEMAGPFPTSRDAAWAGWERFGPGPIYVRQVLPEDPIERVGAHSCRPWRPTSTMPGDRSRASPWR